MKRFFPDKEFPPYAFVPGKYPHPEKPGGHMHDEEITAPALTDYRNNMAYLYAIDLYNHGYYWESHVWWEYLWHLAGRKGETADFLKALIKIAASKLKAKMGDQSSALNHHERFEELLAPLALQHEIFHGLSIESIIENNDFLNLII